MTTENQGEGTPQNNANGADDNAATEAETLRGELLKVTQERDAAKKKARDYEQAAKQADQWKSQVEALTVEKSNLHSQLTAIQNTVRDKDVSQHLTTALEAAGARNVEGAMKLIDRSKVEFGEDGNVKIESVSALVNATKASDPWAFKEPEDPQGKKGNSSSTTGSQQPPTVKGAAQLDAKGAFETELRAAKTPQELQAVLKKYGK